jgi:hypothetical protein
MTKLTPIATVPSMDDGAPITEIRGLIKQVWPIDSRKSGDGRPYKTQAFIVADAVTGATVLVRTFNQKEITADLVGSMISITAANDGGGVSKASFVKTTGDRAGQTEHSVKVSGQASITIKDSSAQQAASPSSGNARTQGQQRHTSNPLKDAGDLLLECLHEASRIVIECPFELEGGAREIATTLFIELRKSGVNASMIPNRRAQEKPPQQAQKEDVTETPEPENEPNRVEPRGPLGDNGPEKPKPAPKMTPAALAAAAVSRSGTEQMDATVADSSDAVVAKAVDFLMKDVVESGIGSLAQVDAAFAAVQKRRGALANRVILRNYDAFLDEVRSLAPAPVTAEEAQIIEDEPEIEVEIDL